MILYQGPSQLDGKPIVAIATDKSDNAKTGKMIQTWIIRADIEPHKAIKNGADRSICGDCPQRHYTGGACYVIPHQAPLSVYRTFKAGGYNDKRRDAKLVQAMMATPIRLGAYGDPAAVPFHVWEDLLARGCSKWTGYSHQWRTCDQRFREIVMASCDSADDVAEAKRLGWRYFRMGESANLLRGEVECLADARGLSCAACGICDGTRADSRSDLATSVAIAVHGTYARRYPSLSVVS